MAETITVTSTIQDSCPIGSRNFNGTTDRIDWANIADLAGSAMTISLWIKWHAETINGIQYLLDLGCSDDTYGIVLYSWENSGTSRALQFFRRGATVLARYTAGAAFAANQWVHLMVTHDGVFTSYSGVHIYVNNVEVTYQFNQNGITETTNLTGKWMIGGRNESDTRNLDGQLAQVAVWNRVITSTERANLTSGYSPAYAAPSSLLLYFLGNTSSLAAYVGGTGTADGTTWIADGPDIKYYAP